MPSIRGSAAHTSSAGVERLDRCRRRRRTVGETIRRACAVGRQVEHVAHRHAPGRRPCGRSARRARPARRWSWSAGSRRVRVVVAGARGPAGDPAHPVQRRVVDPHDQLGGGDVERLPVERATVRGSLCAATDAPESSPAPAAPSRARTAASTPGRAALGPRVGVLDAREARPAGSVSRRPRSRSAGTAVLTASPSARSWAVDSTRGTATRNAVVTTVSTARRTAVDRSAARLRRSRVSQPGVARRGRRPAPRADAACHVSPGHDASPWRSSAAMSRPVPRRTSTPTTESTSATSTPKPTSCAGREGHQHPGHLGVAVAPDEDRHDGEGGQHPEHRGRRRRSARRRRCARARAPGGSGPAASRGRAARRSRGGGCGRAPRSSPRSRPRRGRARPR